VLDNCEHVIGVVAALAERVVSEAPQAHILATSREALRVEGEHVHLLYSLDCPPEDASLTAMEALRYPAAQLFMERAAASGYGAELSDIDAPIVARSCRRLDGIALAIELAASRVGSLGIRGVAELLDNRFGLLWQGRRTALPRHETLNAMLDWSYSLLSEREKVVLCRLSVFVGGFTLQAAGSVASETDAEEAEVIDAVASLVAKSLISTTVINESTYYRLLDTTRTYVATKLAGRGEAARIARRHAIFYSRFLERDEIIQSLFGEHDLSGYAPHIGNVRAALGWALSDHGDVAVGIELAAWAAPLFIGLSLLEECRGWRERALAALDDARRGTRQEMILQEAMAMSSMLTRGHSDQVRAAIERGLVLAEAFHDRTRQLRLLAGLNLFLHRLGEIRGALAVAEQAGVIAHAAKHPAGTVWAEWWVGIDHHFLGNQAAAQLHLERGMALLVGNALASDLAGKIAADGGEPLGNALDIDIVEQHVQAGERADMRDPVAHLTRADHANLADGMGGAAMIAARLRPLLHFDHLRLPFTRCLPSPVNDRAFPTVFQAPGPVPARPGKGLPPTRSRRLERWVLPRPC